MCKGKESHPLMEAGLSTQAEMNIPEHTHTCVRVCSLSLSLSLSLSHTHTHTHTLGTSGAGVSGISRVDLSNKVGGLLILESSVAHEFGQMKAF